MWDTETVRQTSPVVECQITDIHSVAHHQRLVQAAEHRASELTSSVAVLLATAVQIQWCGNILDLVLTSNSALISNVNTVSGMSDHEAVLFQINMNPMKKTTPPHKVYNYKTANWETFKSNIILLTQKYFDRNRDNLDIDSNWNFFHQNYTKLIEQSIPSSMTKSKPHLPWITKNIIRM